MNSKNRNRILVFTTLVIAIAVLLGIYLRPPAPRQPAPDVTLSLLDGSNPKLADYKGSNVLVVFWSVSCRVCAEEIPHLNALHRQREQNNLQVIGINMPYDRPDWTVSFVKSRSMLYPVSLDVEGTIARAFGGIELTPTVVLIDSKGRVVWKKTGRTNFDKLSETIASLNNET